MNPEILNTIIMDVEKIKTVLPHRDPLLLIENVHSFKKKESIIASKRLTGDEPVFVGHFPNNPIYPGVYYIESIAQAGALIVFGLDHPANSIGVLTSVSEARFRRPCRPGDLIVYEVNLIRSRGPFYWLSGKAYVGTEIVAEVSLSVAVTDK